MQDFASNCIVFVNPPVTAGD